jgi:hypothetical protein
MAAVACGWRSALLVAALAVAGGCTVGAGTGAALGNLYIFSCTCMEFSCKDGGDLGTPDAPAPYDLSPHFFAGEPIDDISRARIVNNRLIMRMQRTGNRIEVNDALYFDVQSAYEVARCVRGRTENGQPDWDTSGWCDWTGGMGGTARADHARIKIGPELPIRSSLSLMYSCNKARVVGVGVDDSWIEFQRFGGAVQDDVPSDQRTAIKGDFKVDFGTQLQADFSLIIDDERRIAAVKVNDPIPATEIKGDMHGSFDFYLERGRAAQQFP